MSKLIAFGSVSILIKIYMLICTYCVILLLVRCSVNIFIISIDVFSKPLHLLLSISLFVSILSQQLGYSIGKEIAKLHNLKSNFVELEICICNFCAAVWSWAILIYPIIKNWFLFFYRFEDIIFNRFSLFFDIFFCFFKIQGSPNFIVVYIAVLCSRVT